MKPPRPATFQGVCWVLAAVRCLNAGKALGQVAREADVAAPTIRQRLRRAGFLRIGGKWVHAGAF